MKIAVIGSKGLPPKQGGIEHHCAEIYPRMVEVGHQVDLYARASYVDSDRPLYSYKGVNVIVLPSIPLQGIDALVNSAMAAVRASQKDYDIIHFHALGPSLFTILPKLTCRAKIVVTCHGLDWQRAKWGTLASSVIRVGEWSAVRFADALTVVSQALESYFFETYYKETIDIGNAPVLYSPSSSNTFGESLGLQPKQYILFVGRLVPEKCPDLLIRAFQALRPPAWKLVLVGGSDAASFSSQLLQSAVDDPTIVFTGELTGKRLAEIVRNAGLFVLPSRLEGLPLALLEAMYEKIPILASNIPVHQHLLGDDRGLLFQVDQITSCMTQIQWAIDHPQLMQKMAERAKVYVQLNYNWDDVTAKCLKLYNSLLQLQKIDQVEQAPVIEPENETISLEP